MKISPRCKNQVLIPSILALLLVGTLSAKAQSPDELVVFVNKSVSADNLSLDEIKSIFLRSKTTWGGGQSIVCIHPADDSSERDLFRKKVLQMSAPEEEQYWQNQKVRGLLSKPASFSNPIKAVFKLKGAISYSLRKNLPTNVVKEVAVIK